MKINWLLFCYALGFASWVNIGWLLFHDLWVYDKWDACVATFAAAYAAASLLSSGFKLYLLEQEAGRG